MPIGKLLVLAGLTLTALGLLLLLAPRLGLPLGRLPGDIVLRGERSVFYFPLASSLLLSLVLSALLWLFGRFRH
jgi:hypothetical protein